MSQLKTKDGTSKPEPTCYKLGGSRLGINFELPNKARLFAHYSFLSHIEMRGEDEIAVHYTFGVVRVIGHHLGAIYSLLKQHNLDFARVSEANDSCRFEIEVTKISFEDAVVPDSFEKA
jgi:hypothetical protein